MTLCAVVAAATAWFVHKYFALEVDELLAQLWPPPTRQQIESRRLHKIAGWFSRDCGHVLRHGDADMAMACANDALNSGQRFYVSFDYVGWDSNITSGLAMGSQRRVYEVVTDELGRGAFGAVSTQNDVMNVDVIACDSPPVERLGLHAERFLTCRPR